MSPVTLAVVVPAYNAERTISAAVGSAYASAADEVIVVSDGSTDATAALAADLGATVIVQANAGPGLARRNGAYAAKAKLIVFLDADDELIPQGVASARHILTVNDSAMAVVSRYYIRTLSGHSRLAARGATSLDVDSVVRQGHGVAPPSAILYRREAVFGLDVSFPALEPRFAEDYETFIRASMLGPVLGNFVPACVYAIGHGRSSVSARQELADRKRVQEYYAARLSIRVPQWTEHRDKSTILLKELRVATTDRRWLRALELLAKAVLTDPALLRRAISRRLMWPRR